MLPLVLLLALIALVAWRPLAKWRLRYIPGPVGYPFFGNLNSILKEDLPQYLQRLGKIYGPAFKIWFGNYPFVIINDPDLARKILFKFTARGDFLIINSTATGEDHDMDYQTVLGGKGHVWRLGRRAAEGSLINSNSLAGHVPVMERCALQMRSLLLKEARQGTPVDIFAAWGRMTLAVMGECGFGVNFLTLEDDFDSTAPAAAGSGLGRALTEASRTVVAMTRADESPIYLPLQMMFPGQLGLIKWIAHQFPSPAQKKVNAARKTIISTTSELIKAWQAHKRDGDIANGTPTHRSDSTVRNGKEQFSPAASSFLSLLLEERKSATDAVDKLSDLQIAGNAFIFILAGYETTSTLLSYAVYAMCTLPEVEAGVLAEVDAWGRDKPFSSIEDLGQFPYIEAVLREALRFYSPTTGQIRQAAEEVKLPGLTVPKGSMLMTNSYAFEKDPAIWPQAAAFLPARWLPGGEALGPANNNAYMPFGAGARMCPGHRFAVLEAKLSLVRVLQQVTFRLHARTAAAGPLQTKTGITHAPANGVWVTVLERS